MRRGFFMARLRYAVVHLRSPNAVVAARSAELLRRLADGFVDDVEALEQHFVFYKFPFPG